MARLSGPASGFVAASACIALSVAVALSAEVSAAPPVAAGVDDPSSPLPVAGEAYTVERREAPNHEKDTLPFLRANREFLRARLDELRLALREGWNGDALALDPAWLKWQEMLRDIGTARDSAAISEEWIRRQELLDSVGSLVDLEREMDEMDALLDAQGERLARLEEDFAADAPTALVVLLTGVPSRGVPQTVVLWDGDGRPYRVHLSSAVRASLESGGSAELLHRRVEPRAQHWDVAVEGDAWSEMLPLGLELDPTRHRLTFLEVDLDALEAAQASGDAGERTGSVFRQWVR